MRAPSSSPIGFPSISPEIIYTTRYYGRSRNTAFFDDIVRSSADYIGIRFNHDTRRRGEGRVIHETCETELRKRECLLDPKTFKCHS